MLSKVDIVNQALLRCGQYDQIEKVNWGNPSTPEEMLASRFYDDTRRECLTMGPWNFAETEVQLTRIGEWPDQGKWPYAFAYPADCLMARELNPGGIPEELDCRPSSSCDMVPPPANPPVVPPPDATTCPVTISGPATAIAGQVITYIAESGSEDIASGAWFVSGDYYDMTGQDEKVMTLKYEFASNHLVEVRVVTTGGCHANFIMATGVTGPPPPGIGPFQSPAPRSTDIPGSVRANYHDRRYERRYPDDRTRFIIGNFLRSNHQNVKVIKARVPAAFLTYTSDIDIPSRYTPSFTSMFSWKLAMAFGLALGLAEKQMNTIMQGFMGDQSAALATNGNERHDDEEHEVDWLEGRL